jgi:hypothetical protein
VTCCSVAPWCTPAAIGLVLVSCTGGQTVCDCVPSGLTLSVPEESAAAVSEVSLSGTACVSATQRCIQMALAGGCASTLIVPSQPGTCHVEVYFATGTVFEADVSIVQSGGCCSGLYPDPPGAGQIDVPAPSPDGGLDPSDGAGSDGSNE